MRFLVTGGAGFIGSALIRFIINETDHEVLNLDKLTYAGNIESLEEISSNDRYKLVVGDVVDTQLLRELFSGYAPDFVMHLAAESHVDRSIDGPHDFINTNIVGTYNLLESARDYWKSLSSDKQNAFRFHHISTDEVYGSLSDEGLFSETTPYDPSSPYSASKASSDHLVRAWSRTYGLPVIVTNCSNNYGPYQLSEKLIPLMILNALEKKKLPIYGNGQQVRDWLYVEDHVRALYLAVTQGAIGETYNIGGNCENTNLQVVEKICELLDEYSPMKSSDVSNYRDLIVFVKDRPGHDKRYAIDAAKIKRELHWEPSETFETGLRKTVQWYLENLDWCNLSEIKNSDNLRGRVGVKI